MTVREAAPLWGDPRRVLLEWWSERVDLPLNELHTGHIAGYEKERLADGAAYREIWTEILALRAMLDHAGLTQDIESHHRRGPDSVRLTDQERSDLPSRVLA